MVALGRPASPIRLAIEMRAISLSDKILRCLADWKDADRGMAAVAEPIASTFAAECYWAGRQDMSPAPGRGVRQARGVTDRATAWQRYIGVQITYTYCIIALSFWRNEPIARPNHRSHDDGGCGRCFSPVFP